MSIKSVAVAGAAVLALAVGGFASPVSASAAAPPWSGDHFLGRNASGPQAHVNPHGAAVVTWIGYANVGQPGRVHVATKDAGGRWSAPRALSAPTAVVENVWSGIGGRGRSVVVWTTTDRRVYWTQRSPHHSFTTPRVLGGLHQNLPSSFDMAFSGDAVLGYVSNRHPYVRRLTPSGTWRAPVAVSTRKVTGVGPGIGAAGVQAVVSDGGTITAAWEEITHDQQSGSYGNWQRGGIRPGGTRTPVRTIDRHVAGGPAMTSSPSGDAVAIYDTYAAVPHTMTYRLSDGVWRTWTVPGTGSTHPPAQITPALGGRRASVWWTTSSPADGTTIQVSDFLGGTVSAPAVVHHRATGPEEAGGLGLVAALSPGQRLVAWTDGDQAGARVPHSTVLRDRRGGRISVYRFGARSTAGSLAAAGGHAAFAWLGGPSGAGVRVRIR